MPNKKNITAKQRKAIEQMIIGKTDKEISREIHVAISTLWEWKTKNITFRQELEKVRQAQANIFETRLKELTEESSKILLEVLKDKSEGYVKVALEIFKMTRLKNSDEEKKKQSEPQNIGELLELKFGGNVANG